MIIDTKKVIDSDDWVIAEAGGVAYIGKLAFGVDDAILGFDNNKMIQLSPVFELYKGLHPQQNGTLGKFIQIMALGLCLDTARICIRPTTLTFLNSLSKEDVREYENILRDVVNRITQARAKRSGIIA